MSKQRHDPVRTCIGCRQKKSKKEMIWLNQSPEGAVVVDKKKPHQGRGFYLCPNARCLNLAKKKKRTGLGRLEAMDSQFSSARGCLGTGGRE